MNKAASTEIVQRSKDAFVSDLKNIVGDADTLLRDMANLTSEEIGSARQRLEANLADVRTRIDDARIVFARKASSAVEASSEYLHENPWKAVGVASLVGLVVALLVTRRSRR